MAQLKETLKSMIPGEESKSTSTGSTRGGTQTVFKGYAVKDANKWSEFEIHEFQPKTWTEDDVEIAITHCAVCGSDVHTITGGWGTPDLPLIVGHEIVGHAVRVGGNVQGIKTGDRVGVGAQIGSCMQCRACKTDNENYCPSQVATYNAQHEDGVKTQGGYSTAIRAHQQFVFPIPDALSSVDAASMLCGGLTVFSPLKRNGCGPGKKVGIVGIGGLGHYAILFAKAMGAEVYAFSHSMSKADDIKTMGADHIVDVDEKNWHEPLQQQLDLIVSTRDVSEQFDVTDYLSTLWVHGRLVQVGLPDEPFHKIAPFDFAPNGCFLGGSHIGSKVEAIEMLRLAASKNIKPWVEVMPMSKCGQAVEGVKNNKVRYRYVLTQDIPEATARAGAHQ